jgi:hypothetical protein
VELHIRPMKRQRPLVGTQSSKTDLNGLQLVLWLENNYSFSIITNNSGNSWFVPALEAIPLPDHTDLLARQKT